MYGNIYTLLTIVIQYIYIEIHAYIEQKKRFLRNEIMSHPAINVLSFSNIEKKENDMAHICNSLTFIVARLWDK